MHDCSAQLADAELLTAHRENRREDVQRMRVHWRWRAYLGLNGVRGHEKVPVYGQVVVLAGGQLKVPIPRSSCRPGLQGLGGDGGGVGSHHYRPGSFY